MLVDHHGVINRARRTRIILISLIAAGFVIVSAAVIAIYVIGSGSLASAGWMPYASIALLLGVAVSLAAAVLTTTRITGSSWDEDVAMIRFTEDVVRDLSILDR